MTKDYGFNVNVSAVVRNDNTLDIGLNVNDSEGFEFNELLENVDQNNLYSIYGLFLNKITDAYQDHAKKIDNTVGDEFIAKQDEANAKFEDLYSKIDELENRLKSYEIDNQILRMRNEKVVNDKIKTSVSEKPKTEKKVKKYPSYTSYKLNEKPAHCSYDYLDDYKYRPGLFGSFFSL